MIDLVSASKYKLAFENENMVSRNSNCNFGGNIIQFDIKKPEDSSSFLTGIVIRLIPFIPNQNMGQSKIFEHILVEEEFNDKEKIILEVSVQPEYSYLVGLDCKFFIMFVKIYICRYLELSRQKLEA